MERSDLPEGQPPKSSDLDVGDEVAFHLSIVPSKSQRVIGKVEAIRSDGLVTAAFPQEGWSPMRVTAPAAEFVRVRTSPDVAAIEARVRTQVAEEIAREIEQVVGGFPLNGLRRPKLERGLHASDAVWAARIARKHAGKASDSSPAALPDVVGTPDPAEFLAAMEHSRRQIRNLARAGLWPNSDDGRLLARWAFGGVLPGADHVSTAEGGGVADLTNAETPAP
jgi:hypothetical protein